MWRWTAAQSFDRVASPVHTRRAQREDSRLIAEVILMASRGHLARGFWDLVVDSSEEERLDFVELTTLLDVDSICNCAGFSIAGVGVNPGAAALAHDPGRQGVLGAGQVIAKAFAEFGWPDHELSAAYERLQLYNRAVPRQRPGVWTIEWIATVVPMRRKRLATTLLDEIEQSGRARGYKDVQLTTFIGNEPALAAYQRRGFVVVEERRDPEFEALMGTAGLLRLEKRLA